MIKKIKLTFSAMILMLSLSAAFAPVNVHASPASDAVCAGIGGCSENADEPSVGGTIKKVINLLSILIGIISIIMIIIGGLKYVTSQGESGAVKSAKNTILYALIGLIVVALSQSIVRFVLNKSGATGGATSTNQTTQNPASGQTTGR